MVKAMFTIEHKHVIPRPLVSHVCIERLDIVTLFSCNYRNVWTFHLKRSQKVIIMGHPSAVDRFSENFF